MPARQRKLRISTIVAVKCFDYLITSFNQTTGIGHAAMSAFDIAGFFRINVERLEFLQLEAQKIHTFSMTFVVGGQIVQSFPR